jgi:DNA-binding response OmpR family regulator
MKHISMTERKNRNRNPRIMIVDDEADILSVIKRGLEVKKEFEVDVFSRGEDALREIESHPQNYYDLIITDIRMPQMNGFELYRRIRETNQSIRIAFITAFEINKDEFSKVIPSVEVTDFISKPVSIANLREKIRSMLTDYSVNAAAM